jgi:hypothetical protein
MTGRRLVAGHGAGLGLLFHVPLWPALRLAVDLAPVQLAASQRAALRPDLLRQIRIGFIQQLE